MEKFAGATDQPVVGVVAAALHQEERVERVRQLLVSAESLHENEEEHAYVEAEKSSLDGDYDENIRWKRRWLRGLHDVRDGEVARKWSIFSLACSLRLCSAP